MKQPGVEIRPIVQPDGTAEFNEVFFTDARCPKDSVVGGLNNGWVVANQRCPMNVACLPPRATGVSKTSTK